MGEWLIAGWLIVGLATMIYAASKPEARVIRSVDASVAALVAKLAADGSWQDHLDEDERKMLLKWAREEMEEGLAFRFTHVFGQMRMANATLLIGEGRAARMEMLKAIVGMRE